MSAGLVVTVRRLFAVIPEDVDGCGLGWLVRAKIIATVVPFANFGEDVTTDELVKLIAANIDFLPRTLKGARAGCFNTLCNGSNRGIGLGDFVLFGVLADEPIVRRRVITFARFRMILSRSMIRRIIIFG